MMRNGTIAWGELDRIMQDAAAKNVKVLLSIAKSPEWATANGGTGLPSRANFGLFARFVGGIAARYRGRVHAIQIWNEQNYAVENGGRVAPASYYVDLLGVAYDAIKAVDRNIVVVAGAPTPTGTNSVTVAISDLIYFQQMFAIPKFWSKMDVVGVHAAGTLQPPDALPGRGARREGWNGNTEFFFRRIENVRSLMVRSRQAGRQMWITEFGWATRNNTRGYEYGNYNSLEQQAQYLTRALQIMRTSYAPWIGGAFVWNLNYAVTWREAGNPLHEQASFGLLNPDWSPRPSFLAIRAMRKP
jgi:GH35 family endo-1,4-beta-xylanase